MENKTVGARVDVHTRRLAELAASPQEETLSAWIADVVRVASRQQLPIPIEVNFMTGESR